jgi:hypothetical protein
MPAKSKAQQQFMGIVHGIQKGEIDPKDVSPEAQKAAKEMDPKDAKKFAKTKHKGLPKHVKKECDEPYTEKIKEVVKSLVREILQEGLEANKLKQFLTSKEFNLVKDIVAGKKEIDDYDDLYQKLYGYWQDEMPYGTQKARSGDPYEWIFQKLDSILEAQQSIKEDNPYDRIKKNTEDMNKKYSKLKGMRIKDFTDQVWEFVETNDLGIPYFVKVINGKPQKKQFTLSHKGKDWLDNQLKNVKKGNIKRYWSDKLKKYVTIPEETIKEVSSTDLTKSKVLKVVKNNIKKTKKLGGPVDVAVFGRGSVVISKDKTTFARTYLSSDKWKAKPADNSSSKKIISDDEAAEIVQKIFS